MKAFSTFRNRKKITHSFGLLLVPYGLVYLCDGILTYMFPLQMQARLENVYSIGFIIGFAAIGSILADFILPSILREMHWNTIMRFGAAMSVLFPILTFIGLYYSLLIPLLLGSFISGVYYEFISYAVSQFIRTVNTVKKIEKDWSIVSVLNSFFDFSAVIIGNLFLLLSIVNSVLFVLPLQLFALLYLCIVYQKSDFSRKKITSDQNKQSVLIEQSEYIKSEQKIEKKGSKLLSLLNEFPIFLKLVAAHKLEIFLFTAIWVLDALFWTYGGIWSSQKYGLSYAWVIVAIYQLWSFFGQSILIRFPIIKNMKLFATITLTIANILFFSLLYISNMLVFALVLAIATLFNSINFPIIETLLTNIAKSDESISEDMIGLKRLVYSVAYIFAPIIGGMLGEYYGFSKLFGLFNLVYIVLFGCISLVLVKKALLQKKLSF